MDMWVGNVQGLVLKLELLGLVSFTTAKNEVERKCKLTWKLGLCRGI